MEEENPLVIEVKLGAGDLWKFSMYHCYRGMQGIFNVIFSGAAVFLLLTTWGEASGVYRALLLVCALMFTVWQPFLLYLKAAKQAKSPVIRNLMTLTFEEEGILVTQGEERLELTWDHIAKVEQVKGMIIIYMDRVHAYLLPDSVTGERKGALCALLKEKMPSERRKRI